jgi:IS5 family transposase
MRVVDHAQEHAVGGDQPRLAFDHHGEAGDVLGSRRQLAVDELQFARVDIKLGGRGISRCEALADRDGDDGANQRGRRDRRLALPQQADQLEQVKTLRRARSRPVVRFRLIYRLVIDEHDPQLPFEVPQRLAEGLLFGLRRAPEIAARNKRNKKN